MTSIAPLLRTERCQRRSTTRSAMPTQAGQRSAGWGQHPPRRSAPSGHGIRASRDQTRFDQLEPRNQHPWHHRPRRAKRCRAHEPAAGDHGGGGAHLVRALGVLADQIGVQTLRDAMLQVRQDVEQGSSLSTRSRSSPRYSRRFYIAMVRAGEVGGQLDTVLLKLSSTLESQVELRQKVRRQWRTPPS